MIFFQIVRVICFGACCYFVGHVVGTIRLWHKIEKIMQEYEDEYHGRTSRKDDRMRSLR